LVEEMLAERGICVSYETVRQWAMRFGEAFSGQIRQPDSVRGEKWHLDEVVISIAGEPYRLWRAVDQNGFVLDVLVQHRRDSGAVRRLMTKLLKAAGTPPCVMVTDRLRSYAAARRRRPPLLVGARSPRRALSSDTPFRKIIPLWQAPG
jgi:putative transposase